VDYTQGTGTDDGHVHMLLGAFLLGGLSAREESEVRKHLSGCPECQSEHDYLACVPGWLDMVRRDPAEGDSSAVDGAPDVTK
jgi:hypothetical protein